MPRRTRAFLFTGSHAGCYHAMTRILERRLVLDDAAKEFLVKTMRAYEAVLGVEILTFCVMSNHLHVLLRIPHRPAGFDVPLEVVVARLERAVGKEAFSLIRKELAFWEQTSNTAALEAWRQQQVARMFSLSEFMRCLKQRFTWWYNQKNGRQGTIWESRFTSVIVEEEERALRTIAAYIDLNPVRAGLVPDPAAYRWSGYAEAMAGQAQARRGLVRIIGQMAWPRATAAGSRPWSDDPFPPAIATRALVFYRAILGSQSPPKNHPGGTVIRRGVSETVRQRLTTPNERRLAAEVLSRRVQHFTKGVIVGSRAFIDQWFEENRDLCRGRSRTGRQRGAKPMGRPALRGLYCFRSPKS